MSFQVLQATLEPYAEIVRLSPQVESMMANDPPSELSGMPRLRCLFFVEDKDDPTKMERVRVHSWSVADLRIYSRLGLEKDYSRAIATQALPLLVNDINGLKKPEEVDLKFQMMAAVPDIVRHCLIAGDHDGELFRQRIEQLIRERNHGSGS